MNRPDERDVLRVLVATLMAAAFLIWWPSFAAQAGAAQTEQLTVVGVDSSAFPEVTITVDISGTTLDGASVVHIIEGEQRIGATIDMGGGARQEVVVLIDTSGSMTGAAIEAAKAAAAGFISQLPAGSRVSVVGFGDRPYLVTPMSEDFAAASAAVSGLQASGETALYDGLALAADQFTGAAVPRSVVLVSDGGDTASATTLEAVSSRLVEQRMRVFGVRLATVESNRAPIDQLAAATNGLAVEATDAAGLSTAYEAVSTAAVRQARVVYTSRATEPTTVQVIVGDHLSSATVPLDVPAAASTPERPAAAPAAEAAVGSDTTMLVTGGAAVFAALAMLLAISFRRPQQSLLAQERRRAKADAPRSPSALHEAKRRVGESMERRMERRGQRQQLSIRLEQAGIALRPGEYMVVVSGTAAVAALFGLATGGPVLAALFAAMAVLCARVVVTSRTKRRRRAIVEQLSEMLQQLISTLRAGYGIMQGIDSVSREVASPMADELRRIVHEVQLGRELADALEAMAVRVGGQDIEWVVQAIEINREVGGDLVEVLEAVAATIRAREHLQRQLKTLSAQGRLSARILLAMPFGMALILSVLNPGYLTVLFERGVALMFMGGILMISGWVWLRRIVRLDF